MLSVSRRICHSLRLRYLAEFCRGLNPPYQNREYVCLCRLSWVLLTNFLELRLLSISSHERPGSVGSRNVLSDNSYNGSTFSIATPNAVRNGIIFHCFLAPDLHRSYTDPIDRTALAILCAVTRKKPTKHRHRRRRFRGYRIG